MATEVIRLTRLHSYHLGNKYYQLENVVPADHAKTLHWLDYIGFEVIEQPIMINGFAVLRFVRCKGEKILVNKEYSPVCS